MSLKNLGTLKQVIPIIDSIISGAPNLHALSNALSSVSKDAILSANSTLKLSGEQLACAFSAKGMTASEIASALATNGYGKAATYAAMQSIGLSEEQVQATMANLTFSTSAKTATKSTNTLGMALKGLAAKIGISTAALAGIAASAVVIGAIVTSIKAYNQHMAELVEAAGEAANSWSESNSQISSHIDRINELRTALDSGTMTEEEAYNAKSELLSIQQELSESYGDQVTGIDLVNGSLREQIALLKGVNVEQANRLLNENGTGHKEAKEQMEKTRRYSLGTILNDSEYRKTIEDIAAKYDGISITPNSTVSSVLDIKFTGSAEEADEVINNFATDIRNAAKKIGKEDLFSGIVTSAEDALRDASEILGTYKNIYAEFERASIIADKTTYGDEDKRTAARWLSDYSTAISDYNDALKSGDAEQISAAAEAFNSVDSAIQGLLSGSMSQYVYTFNNARDQLDELAIAQNNLKNSLLTSGTYTSNLANTMKDLGLSDVDFMDAALTDGVQKGELVIQRFINAAIDMGVITDRDEESLKLLAQTLVNLGYLSGSAFGGMSDSIASVGTETTKLISNISKVREVLNAQSTGTPLSIDDFNSAELAEYTSALEYHNGVLQLNAERVGEIVNANAEAQIAQNNANKAAAQSEYLKNASEINKLRKYLNGLTGATDAERAEIENSIKTYQEKNSELLKTCTQYDLVTSSLEAATGAYQNWLNAQNAAQSGDMFDDTLNAINRINDTLNKQSSEYYGRVGHTAYQAALDMIVPDSVDAEDKDAVNKYLSDISSLFTYDSNGNRAGLNIQAFCKQAMDAGLMVLNEAGTDYEIAGGKVMEDFATGMNLALPLVQAMFGEMEEFGGKFSWADEANKTVADLAVSANVAYEKLKEIKPDLMLDLDVSDLDTYEEKVQSIDNTISELQDLKVSADASELDDINSIISYLVIQKQQLDEPAILNVDTSKLSGDAAEAVSLMQEFKTAYNGLELKKALGIDTTEAQAEVDKLASQISSSENDYLVSLKLDSSSVDNLNKSITALENPEILATFRIDETALLDYQAENKSATVTYDIDTAEVDKYNPQNYTRYVNYYYRTFGSVDNPTNKKGKHGVNGTAHASGTAYAGGNWGTAPGGKTLVGELGRKFCDLI